ncbi:MAG: hypothetical protein ACXIVQ_13100 [Acidimicrobiales bacterium]
MTARFAQLSPSARDLGATATAWGDRWWDPEVALLWNPDGAFEEAPEGRHWHLVPQSAWYALGLMLRDEGDDRMQAHRVINAVIDTQYHAPGTVWDGTFARFLEWPDPPDDARIWVDYDPNWRQFVGTTFMLALRLFGDTLPDDLVLRMEASIAHAVRGEDPDRVTPSYTNIALMKAWLEVEFGTRTGHPELIAAGEDLARAIVDRYEGQGAFEEYNSPTYYGIDLYALRLWRVESSSSALPGWGEQLESALWTDIAAFTHAGLDNLSGPWTRSYGMDMGCYLGALALWEWTALGRQHAHLPDLDGPFAHGHDLFLGPCAAWLGADIPAAAAAELREFSGERLVERVVASEPRRVATAWLEPSSMIGAEASDPGWPAWGQYHPLTLHWRRPDGGVGWLRLRHRAPVSAVASRRSVVAVCRPHPRHGPQPTTIEIHAPGLGADAITGSRWMLPGLIVDVDATAPIDRVTVDGDHLTVHHRPVDTDATWQLTIAEDPDTSQD